MTKDPKGLYFGPHATGFATVIQRQQQQPSGMRQMAADSAAMLKKDKYDLSKVKYGDVMRNFKKQYDGKFLDVLNYASENPEDELGIRTRIMELESFENESKRIEGFYEKGKATYAANPFIQDSKAIEALEAEIFNGKTLDDLVSPTDIRSTVLENPTSILFQPGGSELLNKPEVITNFIKRYEDIIEQSQKEIPLASGGTQTTSNQTKSSKLWTWDQNNNLRVADASQLEMGGILKEAMSDQYMSRVIGDYAIAQYNNNPTRELEVEVPDGSGGTKKEKMNLKDIKDSGNSAIWAQARNQLLTEGLQYSLMGYESGSISGAKTLAGTGSGSGDGGTPKESAWYQNVRHLGNLLTFDPAVYGGEIAVSQVTGTHETSTGKITSNYIDVTDKMDELFAFRTDDKNALTQQTQSVKKPYHKAYTFPNLPGVLFVQKKEGAPIEKLSDKQLGKMLVDMGTLNSNMGLANGLKRAKAEGIFGNDNSFNPLGMASSSDGVNLISQAVMNNATSGAKYRSSKSSSTWYAQLNSTSGSTSSNDTALANMSDSVQGMRISYGSNAGKIKEVKRAGGYPRNQSVAQNSVAVVLEDGREFTIKFSELDRLLALQNNTITLTPRGTIH